jgi:hypothetical protein
MADRTTFFLIDRGIFDHWIASEKPFSKFQAWIWIVGKANFADTKTMFHGKVQKIKRGQLRISYRFLANAWGWSEKRVRRFLKCLEDDQMLSVKSTADGTTLTVENYAKFQDVRRTNDHADDHTNDHTGDPQKNNVNKGNNVCDTHAAFSAPSLDEVRAYCTERRNGIDAQSFMDYYANRDWPKDWKAAIRRWESYDRTRTKAEPEQTRDEADRAWADVMSLKVPGRPWEDVLFTVQNEKSRNALNRMMRTGEMELKRPLADGSVQTIPNRQRFVELYRKEMMA